MAFPIDERRRLLAAPGLGPGVVMRLEQAGFDSFDKLRRCGIDAAVESICRSLGSPAWANRRVPLARVVLGR